MNLLLLETKDASALKKELFDPHSTEIPLTVISNSNNDDLIRVSDLCF
jgi:hypothetical protein